MYPYYVETDDIPVGLYQLKDGRFQLIQDGGIGPFMSGHGYLLVEKELAQYLENLRIERATFKDAVIWDRKNDKEHYSHKEIVLSQHFTSEQINDIDLDGDRILTMGNEYIFVSPSLKEKLENSKFSYLKFSEGLGKFAA